MLNAIWFGMILSSVVCALATGRIGDLSTAIMNGAKDAVELSIFLLGSMCAWLGFLKIAEKSGLTELLASAFSPVIDRLFPEYREDREIKGKMCMNFSANFLGLGNAATPLGLAAVSAMAKKNKGTAPTKGMILFVVFNTASIQLLPVNMAAMRSSCGSAEPFAVLPEIWITSFAALVTCVLCCKLAERGSLRGS
ncbi:nucleoside recognition domain-containing protein [Neglectibacter caecimuris]|uniref:nucleoside recognition domain-containing protein n=1 Tax=Neglectibacter caecimuris TaxID=3093658 RepID=UPI002AC92F0C|nr:nucleoside recognition domain-containing protein [Neglectibacter sp. M00184]